MRPPRPRRAPVLNRLFHLAVVSLVLGACAPAAPAPVSGPTPVPTPDPTAPLDAAPENWWLLDQASARVLGTATDLAYRELLADRQPARSVVVAVLDSGVEIDHPDLAGSIWTNPDEVPGNGTDDDNNGYVDDVHGWNFIGGSDGRHVEQDTYEMTRLYAEGRIRFADVRADTLSAVERADYDLFREASAEFEAERADKANLLNQYRTISMALD